MSRLQEMLVFVRVVEAGSLTAAADQLDLAKSAISRRLAELEKRLGVRLLTRTTRTMSLTDAGHNYFEQAQAVLAAADAADASVRSESAQLAGRIRLATPLSFGIAHLGPALREFALAHPAIEFDVDLNDRQVDLVAEGFDLAIRIARPSDSQLAARRLTTVRRVVAASPAWWQEHGMPTQPAELASHRHLEYTNEGQSGWDYTTADGQQGTVRLRTCLRASNGEFLRDAAIAGLGVILQPTFLIHQAVEAGDLQPVLTDCDWRDLGCWAIYPTTRFLPQRTRALVDFLAARFGAAPYWDNCLSGQA
jgi:DNA-binding transcriptional LysR family regulator